MPVKRFKPVTPSRRNMSVADFSGLTKTSPEKSLLEAKPKRAGRNNLGRITMRRRGGGHKQRYRVIDFRREKDGVPGKVSTIEYDPNRSARIALITYVDGEKRYILAPRGLVVGQTIMSGPTAEFEVGNSLPLERIPLGTEVHCVEMTPGRGGQIARAAGHYVPAPGEGKGATAPCACPPGEMRRVLSNCKATIGIVGNEEHNNIDLGKAGRSRWLGRRPKVRGVVMNPVDHPHGGGEGRTSGGRHPCTPWGVPTKGYKTRKKKHRTNRFIIRRRNKK